MNDHHSIVQEVWGLVTGGGHLVSSIYGSLVTMILVKDTLPRRIGYALASVPTAYYTAAGIASMANVTNPGTLGTVGLVCGAVALKILQRLFEAAERLDLAGVLMRAISMFLPGGKK